MIYALIIIISHFLLYSEEKITQQYFNYLIKILRVLWPEVVRSNKVLLFVSDVAYIPFMVEAGSAVQTHYSKVIHITCLALVLHRVTEKV